MKSLSPALDRIDNQSAHSYLPTKSAAGLGTFLLYSRGCRGFSGPFPQPLFIRGQRFRNVTAPRISRLSEIIKHFEYNELNGLIDRSELRGVKLEISIMSGVEDGLRLTYTVENGDGQYDPDKNIWKISIGRREDSDLCLRNDTFISRLHAYIRWEDGRWWLEDCDSTNGTFVENDDNDARVTGIIPISQNQLFRVGHTWMRLEETNP